MFVNYLKNKMKATGAITFAEYMKEVLTNPLYGYYMNKDVFGTRGDFITSPEISQIFGELLGVWCLDSWHRMGRPLPLQLVELGPGRGTLARDILRVFSKFESVHKNDISMHLVETSPTLSQMQIKALCRSSKWDPSADVCYRAEGNLGFLCSWYTHLQQVPRNFSIFIAHEFFDAMPVHKLHKKDGTWREVLVDFDQHQNNFRFVLSKHPTPMSVLFTKEYGDCKLNDVEYSPESELLMDQLSLRICEDGGAALITDYGHQGEKGDTIRGFSCHRVVEPLSNPGQIDITADVNFEHLKKATANREVVPFGPVAQRHFLTNLGIEHRLQKLLSSCRTADEREQMTLGCRKLLDPNEMGERFKFLAVFPSVMETFLRRHPPSGFTSAFKS